MRLWRSDAVAVTIWTPSFAQMTPADLALARALPLMWAPSFAQMTPADLALARALPLMIEQAGRDLRDEVLLCKVSKGSRAFPPSPVQGEQGEHSPPPVKTAYCTAHFSRPAKRALMGGLGSHKPRWHNMLQVPPDALPCMHEWAAYLIPWGLACMNGPLLLPRGLACRQ